MENSIVKTHNFERAKNQIQRFASQQPGNVPLRPFEEDGGIFGWGNHYINGVEMNKFTRELQFHLIESNSYIRKLFEEFKNVYDAFEALDKDYIQGILASILAAEKASSEAKSASSRAEDAQKDIKRTIEALKKTVEKLSEFKSTVSNEMASLNRVLAHLGVPQNLDSFIQKVDSCDDSINLIIGETDKLSTKVQELESIPHIHELGAISSAIESIKHSIGKSSDDIKKLNRDFILFQRNLGNQKDELSREMRSIGKYKERLDKIHHLFDIDTLWDEKTVHELRLSHIDSALKSMIQETKSDLSRLSSFQDRLKNVAHIFDTDEMYERLETVKKELSESGGYILRLLSEQESLKKQISAYTADFLSKYDKIADAINVLNQQRILLDSLRHLYDIDKIWEESQSHNVSLSNIVTEISNIKHQTELNFNGLFAFKSRIEKLNHIFDIDELWSDFRREEEILIAVKEQIANLFAKQNDFKQRLASFIEESEAKNADVENKLSLLIQFKSRIESLDHLFDIDSIWANLQDFKVHLAQIDSEIADMRCWAENNLKRLDDFKNTLEAQTHIFHVDEIWDDVKECKDRIRHIEAGLAAIQENHYGLEKRFGAHLDNFEKSEKSINIKIICAYIAAATGIILSVLNIANVF